MSTPDESAAWVSAGLNPSYEYRERELPPTVTPDLPDYREQELAPTVTPDLLYLRWLCGERASFLTIHVGFDKDGHNVSFQPSALSNQ